MRELTARGGANAYSKEVQSYGLTESLPRIVCGRALSGTYPQTQDDLLAFLNDAVVGWNAYPTPFVWGGKRYERRQRARERCRQRLGGSGATVEVANLIAA